jgi:hypothetical protein
MVLHILTFTFLDSRRDGKTLNRMVPSILRIYSALNLFMNTSLICKCCSQIFELCQTFKGPIRYLHILPLSCLVTVS